MDQWYEEQSLWNQIGYGQDKWDSQYWPSQKAVSNQTGSTEWSGKGYFLSCRRKFAKSVWQTPFDN